MHPIKEILWLCRIYNFKNSDGLPVIRDVIAVRIKTVALSKKDFERVVDAPENSKDFYDWFDKLVRLGVLTMTQKIEKPTGRNKIVMNGYTGTATALINYIKSNPDLDELYSEMEKFFNRDRVL